MHQANLFPTGYTGLSDRGIGEGVGANTNLPLPSGCGHEAYLHAMQRVALPLINEFKPDIIIIANGLDASHVDPLGRMACLSSTYAEMTGMVMTAADALCGGRVVAIHEGGYSEAYVPFCGHRVVEGLASIETGLCDPFLAKFMEQQPSPDHAAWQCAEIDRMASALGF